MDKLIWTTKKTKVSDLIQLEINPRKISEAKKAKLKESLEKFNLVEIPAVNTDLKVIGGNQRIVALLLLGRANEEIDVRFPNRTLTESEVKEYNIISNTHAGEFDFDLLTEHFSDIDLAQIGFEIPGLEQYNIKLETAAAKNIEEDNFKFPDELTTNIQKGDLFQIGEHRLLCGDSTNPAEVEKLMAGKKADCIYTDPPYGISYTGSTKVWDMIKNDQLTGDQLTDFLFKAFQNLNTHAKENVAFYIWYASRTHIQFEVALEKAGLEIKQQLIWNKGMTLGRSDYHWAHEPVLYCKRKTETTPWHGDRTATTILRKKRSEINNLKKEELLIIVQNLIDGATNWEIDKDRSVKYQHPTQKPVPLAARALQNSSIPGQIILDLFVGSGTTMVTAEKMSRICYAMELDPIYCQLTIDRMKKLKPEIKIIKL